MKNLKKLFAVVIAVAMLVTVMAPAFAAGGAFSYEAEAQVLNDLGLYKGISTTEFVPDLGTALNRETGVVMLLRIFGLEADADAVTDADATLAKFSDAASISSWAKKAVAYAVENGLVSGYPDGTFGPKLALNGKAYSTLILKQLGYTPDYSNAPAELADKGGLTVLQAVKFTEKDLIKDDLVGISYGALKAEYSDGATVIEKLIKANPDLEEVAITAGLVEEVTITSLASVPAVKCKVGETADLPKTVTATKSDKTTEEVAVTWGAVDTTKAGTVTVAGTVEGTDLKASVTVTVEEIVLTVDSVTMTNLAKVVVKFNKEVDETTAETLGNYTMTTTGAARVTGGSATLQDDKKTVVLQLGIAATNQETETLTVKNVKDTAGTVIADTSKDITFTDLVIPTALSAAQVAPNQIKVTFSEPVQGNLGQNFKIDSYQYSISGVPALATDLESITITTGSDLPAGSHTIVVNPTVGATGVRDYAGLIVPSTTLTFTAGQDTTPPTVSVVSNTETSVTLKFSETMKAGCILGNANFYVRHTYNSDIYKVTGAAITAGTNENEYVVTFGNAKAFPVGNVTLYLGLTSTSGTVVEDAFGNDLALPTTLTFNNAVDTTAPTVTNVAFVDANNIDVTFSEAVTGATTLSNYSLKTSGGTVVNINKITLNAGTTASYRLNTAQLNGGSYNLTMGAGIKDTSLSQNALVAVTKSLTISDAVAPSITATAKYSSDNKKIVVSFGEAMATSGANSILDLSNYVYYNGGAPTPANLTSWPTGTVITAGTGNTSAIITFTSAFASLSTDDDIVVGRVADVAGNKTAAISTTVNLDPDGLVVANIRAAGVKAIDTTTVTFEVDSPLSAINVAQFTTCNGSPVISASYVNQLVGANTDVNGALVTVKVASGNAWATNNVAATVVMAAGALTTDLGTSNGGVITTAAAGDYTAPAINSITTADADKDGKLDSIAVVYSENLYASSVTDSSYTVAGHTVQGVSLAGATVTLTIDETGYDTGDKPVVTQVTVVKDNSANKNVLAANQTKDTVDGAAPVLVDAVITNAGATAGYGNDLGDTIQLIFSEDMTLKAAYAIADLEADIMATTDTGNKFTADTFVANGNAITVTAAGAANVDVIAVGDRVNKAGTFVANDMEDAVGTDLAVSTAAGVVDPNGVAVR